MTWIVSQLTGFETIQKLNPPANTADYADFFKEKITIYLRNLRNLRAMIA